MQVAHLDHKNSFLSFYSTHCPPDPHVIGAILVLSQDMRDTISRPQSNPVAVRMGFSTSFFPFLWPQFDPRAFTDSSLALQLRYRMMLFLRVTLFWNILWLSYSMLFFLKYHKLCFFFFLFLFFWVYVCVGMSVMCNTKHVRRKKSV